MKLNKTEQSQPLTPDELEKKLHQALAQYETIDKSKRSNGVFPVIQGLLFYSSSCAPFYFADDEGWKGLIKDVREIKDCHSLGIALVQHYIIYS